MKIIFLILTLFLVTCYKATEDLNSESLQRPPSNSLPVMYIDFDGHIAKRTLMNSFLNQNTITSNPSILTQAQKNRIVDMVKYYYDPFKVLITADENIFKSAPKSKRQRIVVTTSVHQPGNSGLAFSSFGSLDETPAYAFESTKNPETLNGYVRRMYHLIAHELGHTVELKHISTYNPITCQLEQTYAFDVIMGNADYIDTCRNPWATMDYPNCLLYENGYQKLVNKFGLK